jgi:ribosome-interacting GTPase 1
MPTNVTAEYKKAKEAFQRASDPADRLDCLKEMLRTIPKHKGTDHLQADIKTRIKQLTEELAGPKKGGARTGPAESVPREGAAQIALIGPPNVGKSSLHSKLTGSHAEVGPYPYTTHAPLPGMFNYEDVQFQLVDLPPISATYMESWMPNALQLAHAVLLVVDLNIPGCVENVAAIKERLDEKRISLVAKWRCAIGYGVIDGHDDPRDVGSAGAESDSEVGDDLDDPFRIYLPTLLVANKSDIKTDPTEIEILEELVGVRFPALSVSVETGEALDRIGRLLFDGLGIARVYTKIPGNPPDKDRPYTVLRGATVQDVARMVHRELADTLKFARIWGSGKFDGQQVSKDHVIEDGDVVELHR